MKTLSFTLLLIAVFGLLAFTNPKIDDYQDFVQQSVVKEIRQQPDDSMNRLFGSLLGRFSGSFIAAQTIRHDYVFFSLYDSELADHRLKVLGIFRNFFVLEGRPDSAP